MDITIFINMNQDINVFKIVLFNIHIHTKMKMELYVHNLV